MILSKQEWLEQADKVLTELKACRPLSVAAVQRLREEIKLQTTYDSNAIEGSTLTLRETVLVVKEGITVGSGKPIRDVMAARGYAAGFDAIFDFIGNRTELSEALILNFHKYVMLGALPQSFAIIMSEFWEPNAKLLNTGKFLIKFVSLLTGLTTRQTFCILLRKLRYFMPGLKQSIRFPMVMEELAGCF